MSYNGRRHLELSAATELGTPGAVDDHVLSIKRTYDDLGRLEKITSYANDDGTGTVRNEIELEYNDLDQVATSYQSHEDVVDGSTLDVAYVYDDATDQDDVFEFQHRLEQVVYPDGREVFYDYDKDISGGVNPANRLGRVRGIYDTDDQGDQWTAYDYSGVGRLAVVDYPEIDLKLDYFQGTSGTYAGLDRFGRVKDQYWAGYGSTDDADRFRYGHDFAGNRTYRDIDDSIYATDDQDQAYMAHSKKSAT